MLVEGEPKRALGASLYFRKGYDPTQLTLFYATAAALIRLPHTLPRGGGMAVENTESLLRVIFGWMKSL